MTFRAMTIKWWKSMFKSRLVGFCYRHQRCYMRSDLLWYRLIWVGYRQGIQGRQESLNYFTLFRAWKTYCLLMLSNFWLYFHLRIWSQLYCFLWHLPQKRSFYFEVSISLTEFQPKSSGKFLWCAKQILSKEDTNSLFDFKIIRFKNLNC